MLVKRAFAKIKLLWALPRYTFIKLQIITPSEIKRLGKCDVKVEHLSKNFKLYTDQVTDYNLPDFQVELLQERKISSFCPHCGKKVFSDQSFPLIEIGFDLPIFYRFHCCKDYFLIIGRSPSKRQGIYIPNDKLVISFEEYLATPHNHHYYSKAVFVGWVNKMQYFIKKNLAAYNSYCNNDEKKLLLIIGCLENFGHHLPDELGGAFQIQEHFSDLPCVYLGPNNWFSFQDLFKTFPVLNTQTSNSPSEEEIFKFTLNENALAFRATSLSDIPEKLAQSMIEQSRGKCRSETLQVIEESEKTWPLLWITLRSSIRYWDNEQEALPLIINKLACDYPKLGVIFDGASSEFKKYDMIRNKLSKDVSVYCALNCNIQETIQWVSKIDYFLAPLGKGSLFTTIANKPGLLHTHSEWGKKEVTTIIPTRRENAIKCSLVSGKIIGGRDAFSYNYEIPYEVILRILQQELAKLKPRIIFHR